MRKLLAFLVLLMLPWTARGQALAEWYYWFDYDSSPHESGKVIGQQFQIQPDVSHLAIGVHTLYVQVVDTAGVYSSPVGTMFFKVPDATTIDKLFYTIDAEETPTVLDFGDGSFTLDVSKYQPGFHRITLQVMDKQNGVSDVMPYMFYKVPQNNHLAEFRYWFDSDATVRTMPYGQGHYILDVAHLIPGFHFINYYVADGDENMTKIDNAGFFRLPVASNQKLHYWFAGDTVATQVPDFQDGFIVDVTRLQEGFNTIYFQLEDNGPTDIMIEHFIKIPQTENGGDMTLVCIIDGKVVGEEKVSAHGGVVKCDMDVSNMEVGLHKAMFQLITPSGAGSSIAETYFIRTLTNEDVASMQCSYTIDGFKHHVHKGTSTNGVFHFDLPVDDVEDGLHRIDYMLVAENGASTTQGSAWFFKTPVGGNGITQYDYWLNDKSDVVQSVVLDEPKDPFQLIKLLPIPSEPIRSSCFHFEVKDEKPMMYAKNDIHFRFHDRTGRWVDESKQYVDYNTSAVITDIAQLKSTQTFTRPDENDIKWFKFEAAPGDTIGFKSSQATSLQVFAPSGKEILTTMGDKSVQYTGAHTWEDGTYYVAVHDVTGSKPNITLDYMHMDKYDVVSQDVHVVGNGGCSTITFQGNGFKDLYAVDLKDSKGNIIESIDVGHESDATTTVTFDFTGAKIGKYNAVFHFTEEDRTITNSVTIEEAKEIELATTVHYPSTFLRGSSVTYTVEITNKGNMTAYAVPLFVWIKSNKKHGITNVTLDGVVKESVVDRMFLTGDLTDDDIRDLKSYVDALDDDNVFMKMESIDEYGDTIFVRSKYFFVNLGPKEKKNIRLTVKTNEAEALAYFTVPDDWPSYSIQHDKDVTKARALFKSSSLKDKYCCISDKINCVATNLGAALDVASLFSSLFGPQVAAAINISDCLVSGAGAANKTLSYIVCDSDKPDFSPWKAAGDVFVSTSQAGLSCISGKLSKYGIKYLKSYNPELKSIGDMIGRFVVALDAESMGLDALHGNNPFKCLTELGKPKPGCPPIPPHGGSSRGVNSLDPNDIYGHVALSGSKFVGESVVSLPYRIEFENDTTFATASAHMVEIKDTLDSNLFDLATFAPTDIKIGNKTEHLDGTPNFIKTIDMRPAIYAITQVEGLYDEKKGIVTWQFTSLDPMTMEPTDDVMQGFLPVNYDGSGIGEVAYNINRKVGLSDGTAISNKASIIFDNNDAIETPVWTNIIDAVPPVTHVSEVEQVNDTIVRIHFDGNDNRSGVWKYSLYVQYGEGSSWIKFAECSADSSYVDFSYYDGMDYGFCVLATDSAGNVEKKELTREGTFVKVNLGDVNCDGEVNTLDASLTTGYYLEQPVSILAIAADVNGDGEINTLDATQITQMYLNANTASRAKAMMARQRLKVNRTIKK